LKLTRLHDHLGGGDRRGGKKKGGWGGAKRKGLAREVTAT